MDRYFRAGFFLQPSSAPRMVHVGMSQHDRFDIRGMAVYALDVVYYLASASRQSRVHDGDISIASDEIRIRTSDPRNEMYALCYLQLVRLPASRSSFSKVFAKVRRLGRNRSLMQTRTHSFFDLQ